MNHIIIHVLQFYTIYNKTCGACIDMWYTYVKICPSELRTQKLSPESWGLSTFESYVSQMSMPTSLFLSIWKCKYISCWTILYKKWLSWIKRKRCIRCWPSWCCFCCWFFAPCCCHYNLGTDKFLTPDLLLGYCLSALSYIPLKFSDKVIAEQVLPVPTPWYNINPL